DRTLVFPPVVRIIFARASPRCVSAGASPTSNLRFPCAGRRLPPVTFRTDSPCHCMVLLLLYSCIPEKSLFREWCSIYSFQSYLYYFPIATYLCEDCIEKRGNVLTGLHVGLEHRHLRVIPVDVGLHPGDVCAHERGE